MLNRIILPLGFLVLASAMSAQQPSRESQSIGEPPKVVPDNCSVLEVTSVSSNGQSGAYNLLGYEIAALDVGHRAESNNALAVKSMNSPPADPVGSLADTFRNLDAGTDGYLCGAYIAGQYKAANDDQRTFRETNVSVYNRLAIINTRMKEYIKNRIRNFEHQDSSSIIENANTLAKLTHDRNAAFSDLVSAATLSALLSLYADPSAPVVDTLNMNAAERGQLLARLDEILTHGSPDSFTQVADILKSFLTNHTKVRD
jgi:hypothetical protein